MFRIGNSISLMETMLSPRRRVKPCERSGRGVCLKRRGGMRKQGEASVRHQSLKAFERLTSGQMGFPETRDLREQGGESQRHAV